MGRKEELAKWEAQLPPPSKPLANYVPVVVTGNLAYTAGVLPLVQGRPKYLGSLGRELSVDEGYDAARVATLNALSMLKAHLGGLSRIRRVVQCMGFVASAPGFHDQPKVLNGATDLLVEVFGDEGKPTRMAVGVSELPLGAPVEVAMVVEVG